MAWFVLFLLCAGPRQDLLPREVLMLSRIQRHMTERLARLPNYTCLETIDRFTSSAPGRPLERVDTVQVEVSHVGSEELYAWPGARGFQDNTPASLIGWGPTSTGEFAVHLRAIFLSHATTIRYRGEESSGGRPLLRYDFKVPLFASRWTLNVSGTTGEAASRGSFWVAPESLEVVRLEVEADEIPPTVPLQSLTSRTEYARVRLGEEEVWLPQSSELILVNSAGAEDRNRIEFSHCRRYASESAISFAEFPPVAPPAARPPAELVIPEGVLLPARLETAIDSTRARVGDLLTATLTAEVRIGKRETLPKGAVLHGRIRHLRRDETPEPHYVVGLEFSELEFAGRRGQFFGRLEKIGPAPGLEFLLSKVSSARRTQETARPPELPGIGTFFMRGVSFHLAPGLSMQWKALQITR